MRIDKWRQVTPFYSLESRVTKSLGCKEPTSDDAGTTAYLTKAINQNNFVEFHELSALYTRCVDIAFGWAR